MGSTPGRTNSVLLEDSSGFFHLLISLHGLENLVIAANWWRFDDMAWSVIQSSGAQDAGLWLLGHLCFCLEIIHHSTACIDLI